MIYADANIFIRLLEGDAASRGPIVARIQPFQKILPVFVSSRLSLLECRVKPLRQSNQTLLAQYNSLFASSEVQLIEIDVQVIDKATELRAIHYLKTPDAIHLASAIIAGATSFMTGDKDLAKVTQIHVEVV